MKRLHIVGCPRSGTTLVMELISACYRVASSEQHESTVFDPVTSRADIFVTKKPTDILCLHRIFEQDKNLFVIYVYRDPRSVITSLHHSNRDIYFCNYKIWKSCENAAARLKDSPRFFALCYEDLIESPDACQEKLNRAFPFLNPTHKFSEFHQFAEPTEDAKKAMEGLRSIDRKSLAKWHDHLPRIAEQLVRNPPMRVDLYRLGYEQDAGWENMLGGVMPKVFPCRYPERAQPFKTLEKNFRMWWRARHYLRQLKTSRLLRKDLEEGI